MNIETIIQTAKLGRSRKDAQIDTCAVFAAALFDVLSAHGFACKMVSAVKKGIGAWAHAVVQVGDLYYDSMGEFSTDIYRKRAKIHPTVPTVIEYQPDSRCECFESEFDELHVFYVKMLNKAIFNISNT